MTRFQAACLKAKCDAFGGIHSKKQKGQKNGHLDCYRNGHQESLGRVAEGDAKTKGQLSAKTGDFRRLIMLGRTKADKSILDVKDSGLL